MEPSLLGPWADFLTTLPQFSYEMESILVPVSEFLRLNELIHIRYFEHGLAIASTQ